MNQEIRRKLDRITDILWAGGVYQVILHQAFSRNLTAEWREEHMKELLAEMEEQAKYLELSRMENAW